MTTARTEMRQVRQELRMLRADDNRLDLFSLGLFVGMVGLVAIAPLAAYCCLWWKKLHD